MKRLIVHMGMPKCGSSSIQHYMAEMDDHHRTNGLCYPQSLRAKDGYRNHEPLIRLSGDTLKRAVDEISEEIMSESNVKTVFVSAEGWGRRDRMKNLQEFLLNFSKRNPDYDTSVVVYLRNPFSYIESCYAQLVVAGLFGVHLRRFFKEGNGDIDAFVAEFEKLQGYRIYSNLSAIRLIQESLPQTRVSFRSFEQGDSHAHSLIADLCNFLGVEVNDELARMPRNTRINLRQLVVLRRARRKLPAKQFQALRLNLLNHPLCSIEVSHEIRLRGVHIGRRMAEEIRQTIENEQRELEEIVDTGVTGLCANKWRVINSASVMNPDELRKVIADAKNALEGAVGDTQEDDKLLNFLVP